MGSRVNYVVVGDGEHRVHALGGGSGLQLDVDFALGPQFALRRLDGEDFAAGGAWFDDVSCEGAVLIDADRRVLLLFTTLHNYLAYRAAMLQGYAATWPGWEIRWAYDGIGDLMAYVGQDPAAAHDDNGPDLTLRNEFDFEHDLMKAIVTVGGRRYGLSANGAYRRWRMGHGPASGPDPDSGIAPAVPESAAQPRRQLFREHRVGHRTSVDHLDRKPDPPRPLMLK